MYLLLLFSKTYLLNRTSYSTCHWQSVILWNFLSHEIVKPNLVRGLSCFDSAVILQGTEEQYIAALERLTSHFVNIVWSSSSEKIKAVSQYFSFVAKLRVCDVTLPENWFQVLVSHYELQCRPKLCQLFK